MVSSAAVTMQKFSKPKPDILFERIRDMKLKSPRVVGFGISNKDI